MLTLWFTFILAANPAQAREGAARRSSAEMAASPALRAHAQAFEANRLCFRRGEFLFRWESGVATGVEWWREALAKPYVSDGYYVFDGPNARYECIPTPQPGLPLAEEIGKKKYRLSGFAARVATDSKRTIDDIVAFLPDREAPLHSPRAIPGVDAFKESLIFPFQVGMEHSKQDSLFDDYEKARSGQGVEVVDLKENSTFEGVSVLEVTFSMGEWMRTYWIDSRRGAIPLCLRDRDPSGVVAETRFDEIKEMNGCWLPWRRTAYRHDGRRVTRLEITSGHTGKVAGNDVFSLKFEKPHSLADVEKRVIHAARTSWNPATLPSPRSRDAKPLGTRRIDPEPVLDGEASRSVPWLGVGAVGAVAVVVGCVAWMWWKGVR